MIFRFKSYQKNLLMAKCKLNSEISSIHSITVCYKQEKEQS